jgi:hypothetical protein
VNLDWTENGFQATGAEPTMGVQHLAGVLWETKRRSHISVTAELEMSLQQQALYLAALGLLLRLNLVERQLEGAAGRQPSLQRSEFAGRWRVDDGDGETL